MIKVIGTENCSRCDMVKKLLADKNVEFDFVLFADIENQAETRKEAASKKMLAFPLIIKDGELVTLQEVLN